MTSDITLTETTVTTITGSTVSGLQNNPVSAATPTIDLRAGVGGTNSLTILAYTSDNYLNIHQI